MPHSPPVNQQFLDVAQSLIPKLSETKQPALGLVKVVKDESAIMGWKAEPAGKSEDLKPLVSGDQLIFDFGGHRTGFLTFDIEGIAHSIEPADAPARLRITFGEILNDVAESFEPYTGWLSPSWLPDEVVNIDYLPQKAYTAPRRHAFRYVKIEVIATSERFGVRFSNVFATALTSAPTSPHEPLSFTKEGSQLSDAQKERLRRIDDVSMLTLKNCMQTVYEDGPRRDMRLWIGDLRLQALTSYLTFKDYDLAKRCLYLFAAMPFDDTGLLCACVYEKPEPHFGGNSIVDYAMLYSAALFDYVAYSGDNQTGVDLFPTALKQFELFMTNVGDNNLYQIPESGGWHFIDWQEGLDKQIAEHCILIFSLQNLLALSRRLGLPEPSLSPGTSNTSILISHLIEQLIKAGRTSFDRSKGLYMSGPEGTKHSWASQAWAVLAGLPESKAQARLALKTVYEDEEAVIANTPYLHHYLCEAFIQADMQDYALKHILEYWGSMVDAGAETFFEGWDPKRPRFSPYKDLHINSYCHAWSCTPSMLLRQMGYA